MRKSVLAASVLVFAAGFIHLNCGPSYCKQYVAKFCEAQDAPRSTAGTTPSSPTTGEKSPGCAQAKEKVKNLSSKECRIQLNTLDIEEQSKQMDKVLE